MSDINREDKKASNGYSFGEIILLAVTGIIPGMIIIWAYKKFIKNED